MNIHGGKVTNPAVAETFGLECVAVRGMSDEVALMTMPIQVARRLVADKVSMARSTAGRRRSLAASASSTRF